MSQQEEAFDVEGHEENVITVPNEQAATNTETQPVEQHQSQQADDQVQNEQDPPNNQTQVGPDDSNKDWPRGDDSKNLQRGRSPSQGNDDGNSRSNSLSGSVQDRRDANPETYTQIYIAKLSRETGNKDIYEQFSRFGQIKTITIKKDFAFVDYTSHEAAVEAVDEMDGKKFVNGEVLKVQQSLPRSAQTFRKDKRGPMRANRDTECWTCGGKGHLQFECPRGERRDNNRGRDDDRRGERHPRGRDDNMAKGYGGSSYPNRGPPSNYRGGGRDMPYHQDGARPSRDHHGTRDQPRDYDRNRDYEPRGQRRERSRSYNNHRQGGGRTRSRSRSYEAPHGNGGSRGYNGGTRGPPRGEFNGNNQGTNSYMMPGENRNDVEQGGGPADMNRPPPNMPSGKFQGGSNSGDGGRYGPRPSDGGGFREQNQGNDYRNGDRNNDRDHFKPRGGQPYRGGSDFQRRPRDDTRGNGGDRMRGGEGRPDIHRLEEKERILRQGLCFRCKEKGHKAMECPKFPNDNNPPPRNDRQIDLRDRIDNRGPPRDHRADGGRYNGN